MNLPDLASRAMRYPSRDEANRTPPPVDITPFELEAWNSLKSHIVLPVSGSSALIPADGSGSFGPRGGALPRPRPMYWRPGSYGAVALVYCWPLSEYSR